MTGGKRNRTQHCCDEQKTKRVDVSTRTTVCRVHERRRLRYSPTLLWQLFLTRASQRARSSNVLLLEMSYTSIAPTAPWKYASSMHLSGKFPAVSHILSEKTKPYNSSIIRKGQNSDFVFIATAVDDTAGYTSACYLKM